MAFVPHIELLDDLERGYVKLGIILPAMEEALGK